MCASQSSVTINPLSEWNKSLESRLGCFQRTARFYAPEEQKNKNQENNSHHKDDLFNQFDSISQSFPDKSVEIEQSKTELSSNYDHTVSETCSYLESLGLWPLKPRTPTPPPTPKPAPTPSPVIQPSKKAARPVPDIAQEIQIAQVSPLAVEEFAALPKYMKGRLVLGDINCIVAKLNEALICKYSLVTAKFGRLSKVDKNKVIAYREQESGDTVGRWFCVQQELKDLLGPKDGHNMLKVVPILRHAKRIQEIRGGGLVRIAVL